MTIGDKIRDEKLQYDISKEAVKVSTLSSGKINKYEYKWRNITYWPKLNDRTG